MADETKTADPAAGAEPRRQTREESRKTKSYVLKDGATIDVIVRGEAQSLKGTAKGDVTVDLTEEQAAAFNDKLAGEIDPQARNMANATTIIVGEETGGAATITEAAALAGQAEGIESKDVDKPEDANTDPVDRPAGSQTADVSTVGQAEAGAKPAPAPAAAKDAGAGQASTSGGVGGAAKTK